MKKLVFLLVIMKLLFAIAVAETTIIKVPEEKTLDEAVALINAATSGEYVISLTEDITTNSDIAFISNATKTIQGNGHTITYGRLGHSAASPTSSSTDENYMDAFIIVWSGMLNLERGTDSLTLTSSLPAGDSSSGIQVIANEIFEGGENPVLNMYDGVTISNWQVDNSYGAGVRVYSHELKPDLTATFNMHGGTIENCGFSSGSNQYGGGVAVLHNGVFNMRGGLITGCKAVSGGGVCLTYTDPTATGIFIDQTIHVQEPAFYMTGGTISGNLATKTGGGVNVYNGSFVMSQGSIAGNQANSRGGGVCVSGDAYINLSWQANFYARYGYYYNLFDGKFEMSDGEITHNYSTAFGGGIGSQYFGPVKMTGGILCNNRATQRGDDLAAVLNVYDIHLPSATEMNKKYESFQREGNTNTWSETRFLIDGWYVDGDDYDSTSARWEYDQAFEGDSSTNVRMGDTVLSDDSNRNIYVKAAFTAYDAIKITKTWDDAGNVLGKRPESLTFRLTDPSGNSVRLRTYDEDSGTWTADGAEAIVTLTPADEDSPGSNKWTGIIEPLPVGDYSDTTQYLLKEDDTGIFYVPDTENPTITFTPDEAGGIEASNPGVFSAAFTNVGRQPVTIVKIWNDANNKDSIRPAVLNTQLVIGSTPQADMDGRDVFPLEEDQITHTWTTTVYLPAKDYSALQATEGAAAGYEQSNYHRSIAADGTLSFVFENKHTPAPAEMNTVANGSMVNINYEARKIWPDTPPTVAKPNVKIKLTGDNGYSDVQSLVNHTATFANIPKYLDNERNIPVTYTLSEVLDDPLWIEVNGEFYSLDGMGKYIPRITNVTAAEIGSTGADGTVTTGTIENNYVYNQPTTSAMVTKRWNDHQNENGARPRYLKLGLFKAGTDSIPASTVIITGQMNGDAWNGTFTGLPLYDDSGAQIDYSFYIIKEAYPTALNPDGTPAGWDNWVGYGKSYTMTRDGHTYKYDYSVATEP